MLSTDQSSMWLDPEFLQWPYFGGGGTEPRFGIQNRAYEIWSHAETRLRQIGTDLDLVDVIATLKRAIEQRMRILNGLYSFKMIPVKDKPRDLLGLLGFFDVVRPLMFRKLTEIRNSLEHEDGDPPDTPTCRTYLELTWYFLKSTDGMLKVVTNELNFQPHNEESGLWVSFEYGPACGWNPTLSGWVKSEFVSNVPLDSWILISPESLTTREHHLKKQGGRIPCDPLPEGSPTDIYLSGDVRGPQNLIIQLTKLYLAAS
jgi:hypothetical protein